jgi:hypothetical protein
MLGGRSDSRRSRSMGLRSAKTTSSAIMRVSMVSTCFCVRGRNRTTSSRFFLDRGCRPLRRALVYLFASRSLSAPEKRQEPTPVRCTSPHGERVPSFGSLKTEEKTERQCGQFSRRPSGRREKLSVNFAVGLPAGSNTNIGGSSDRMSLLVREHERPIQLDTSRLRVISTR